MNCPYCLRKTRVVKKGRFNRKSTANEARQRYFCFNCEKNFSAGTGTLSFRQRRPDLEREIFNLVISGVSQRRCSRLLRTTQKTVARKIVRLATFAKTYHAEFLSRMVPVTVATFDDMETFEHSKCKPVSITVAVEDRTRFIIAARASQMSAKGRLAKIAFKRYGYRRDKRRKGLAYTLSEVSRVGAAELTLKSDMCPRYPKVVSRIIPRAKHEVHRSRRACVVGQGELKAGGFDPLFSLNHTCAMFRDNMKRLSRKTWCTTKRVDRLQCLLDIYTVYHNEWIVWFSSRGQVKKLRSLQRFSAALGPPKLIG